MLLNITARMSRKLIEFYKTNSESLLKCQATKFFLVVQDVVGIVFGSTHTLVGSGLSIINSWQITIGR